MSLRSTILHALWLTTFCNAHLATRPVTQRITRIPCTETITLADVYKAIPCTECTVDGPYSTTTVFGAVAPDRTNSPTSDIYFVISAYGVTSSLSTNGACNLVEIPPKTLSPPFSIFSTPGNEDMGYTVASSFIGWLGLVDCGFEVDAPTNPASATDVVGTSRSPSSSTLSSSSSTLSLSLSSSPPHASPTPAVSGASSSLDIKQKIILGTVLPTTLLVLALFATLAWLAHRKRKLAATATNKGASTSRAETQLYLRRKAELVGYEKRLRDLETQRRGLRDETRLYLQQKSELEDYERRVHELEARSRAYEIG